MAPTSLSEVSDDDSKEGVAVEELDAAASPRVSRTADAPFYLTPTFNLEPVPRSSPRSELDEFELEERLDNSSRLVSPSAAHPLFDRVGVPELVLGSESRLSFGGSLLGGTCNLSVLEAPQLERVDSTAVSADPSEVAPV